METFTQPALIGYRQLTEEEAETMNEIKAAAEKIGELTERLKLSGRFDQRWVAIGVTDLQKGFMALSRSVARPTTF